MSARDVYHAGEILVQERTGDRAVALRRSMAIGERLGEAARGFLAQQAVAAVGTVGLDGALWASLWRGVPGWLRSDMFGERVRVAAIDGSPWSDPVRPIIQAGAPLAMLVIDFIGRRRLRLNGTVEQEDTTGFDLRVCEAFGNCGKYIQRWQAIGAPPELAEMHVEQGKGNDVTRLHRFALTDTAFITTVHPERGLDVSHRGGDPGFIRVEAGGTLRFPDYPGNGMYQTLGNLEVDPRAGLVLVDFTRRRMLSLSGHAHQVDSAEDPAQPTGGTGRYWCFTTERWTDHPLPPEIRWTLLERSPFNPPVHPMNSPS